MSTRSRNKLSGGIRDYLLEAQRTNIMPDTINPTGGEQLGALLAGVGGDPTQLYALLAQSLTTVTESNKQLQEMLNNQRVAQPKAYTKL